MTCRGYTKERINANDSRTVHACTFAAVKDGYCVHHHPARRQVVLERQKRHYSGRLAVVLTELIGVSAEMEEIQPSAPSQTP